MDNARLEAIRELYAKLEANYPTEMDDYFDIEHLSDMLDEIERLRYFVYRVAECSLVDTTFGEYNDYTDNNATEVNDLIEEARKINESEVQS